MTGLVPVIHAVRLPAAPTTILRSAFSGNAAATQRRG
jgi:hypothetical protein